MRTAEEIEQIYAAETGCVAKTNRHYIEWLQNKLKNLLPDDAVDIKFEQRGVSPVDFENYKDWPESSSVKSTSYDVNKHELTVEFRNGKKYPYHDVPAEVWVRLVKTNSIGKFINSEIKPKYAHA